MLRTSDDLNSSYYVRLEPENRRLVFDLWPRGSEPLIVSVDGGYMPGLDRWADFVPDSPVGLKILVDRTLAVIYVDGRFVMNVRMYDLPAGQWGFFVEQGSAQFSNFKITEL